MKEREAKLAVPPGFDLPELGGLDDGFLAEPQPTRRLRTTYYDTADLRLARWDASLRYRPGEGWTVKLPEGQQGVLLVRAEHVFSGDGRRPPAEALALVRPFVRTAGLSPSVRMRTLRRPVELREPGGSRLGELVDDEVQVLEGSRVLSRFRELEVELEEDADLDLLEQVVDQLLDAGAQAADPTPKYLRALAGRERVLGPEVVQPEVDDGSSVEELLRHDLATSTLRLFRHEAGVRIGEDPEAVHQARVATRRIRSTLRTFSKLLDEEWTDRLRDDLKWLADLLGQVRDTDVLLERFEDHLAELPAEDAKAGRRLLAKLSDQRDQARRRLLGAMAQEKYAVLLDDLVAAAAAPALLPGGDRPAVEVMPPMVTRPWKRLRKEVRKAGDDPPDEVLHQIRIRAKRARYAAEAVEPVFGKPAEDFADAIADLQDVLGDHQDAVVGEAWLREAAASARRRDVAIVAGLLIAAERASAAGTRDRWRDVWKAASRKSLRAWLS
ncbi:MAG TPA: CYTH and CHAD domain-containing protein [Actinomycetes bacterium]|nr:CYTH and CHAD domain-containing protein [Actinomycetes bacterium]